MRADWTRPEPTITAYLQSLGRYGVRLDVVYGSGAPGAPHSPAADLADRPPCRSDVGEGVGVVGHACLWPRPESYRLKPQQK